MTEVENHSAPKEVEDELEDVSKLTQIQNKWVSKSLKLFAITIFLWRYTFWFRGGTANASKTQVINYQESIRKIGSFQTVIFLIWLPSGLIIFIFRWSIFGESMITWNDLMNSEWRQSIICSRRVSHLPGKILRTSWVASGWFVWRRALLLDTGRMSCSLLLENSSM